MSNNVSLVEDWYAGYLAASNGEKLDTSKSETWQKGWNDYAEEFAAVLS